MTEQSREKLLASLFGPGEVPAALSDRMLRTGEVAELFGVSPRTVAEWARRGRLVSVRTPGGHRLYPAKAVKALLESSAGATG